MPATTVPIADALELAVYRLETARSAPAAPVAAHPHDRDLTESLLRENARWFCQLRWLVVIVLLATGLLGSVPSLAGAAGLAIRPAWPITAGLVLAGLNAVFVRLVRTIGRAPSDRSIRPVLWTQIITDLLILTGVIHWLGRGLLAAPFMYLFHIILACMVFTPRESLAVAALAAVFHAVALFGVERGWLRESSVLFTPAAGPAAGQWASHVVAMFAIWTVIWYLVSRLAATLRRREIELAQTNLRLKANSEERATHMLQTTHQLKAPFAAIHALAQLLLGGYSGALPAAATAVIEKISTRCVALSRQIQEMLQLANLRSQGQTPPLEARVDLAGVIEEVIGRVEPAARQRGIRFEKAVQSAPVTGVGDHLTMLVDNLLVNAVNYSHDGGVVEVACETVQRGDVRLIVRDHGIGIPREKLPRVFDDYYRAEEAVQHNRASTGLGLAIVRQIASASQLGVQVESAPGWGTRFTVTFPSSAAPAP